MTDKPQRPVQSSGDALDESADEASAALDEVNEDLRTSLESIARLAGNAGSSIGMQNLATDLQEIGATMARALGNADEQVTATFAAEANALHSLLRDPHVLTREQLDNAMGMFANDSSTTMEPAPTLKSDEAGDDSATHEWNDEVGNRGWASATRTQPRSDKGHAHGEKAPESPSPLLDQTGVSPAPEDTVVEIAADNARVHEPRTGAGDSRSGRTSELRRKILSYADDVDAAIDMFGAAPPLHEAPQPPPGQEVDNPVSAVALVIMITWELLNQWNKKRRE